MVPCRLRACLSVVAHCATPGGTAVEVTEVTVRAEQRGGVGFVRAVLVVMARVTVGAAQRPAQPRLVVVLMLRVALHSTGCSHVCAGCHASPEACCV